jgi:hypothetical protein
MLRRPGGLWWTFGHHGEAVQLLEPVAAEAIFPRKSRLETAATLQQLKRLGDPFETNIEACTRRGHGLYTPLYSSF